MKKYYRFKNVKHSVIMILEAYDSMGNYFLRNRDYPTIKYTAKLEEIEEIK